MMEIFKSNYVINDYDIKEETLFAYDKHNCSFFYPLIFSSYYNKNVIFVNSHPVDVIRKYNLYYSLFYIVNKLIWNKYKYFNKKTSKLSVDITEYTVTIEDAIKNKILPSKYYALEYAILNKHVLYSDMKDDILIKVIDSLIYFSNTLGILTSSHIDKYELSKFRLFTNSILINNENYLSLSITVQLRLFIDWFEKKTIIITGSTGIGKTKIIPKLLFYISLLFDGYTNYSVFNISDYVGEKKVFMALPRKLLVKSIGKELLRSLNMNVVNNLIEMKYKNVQDDETYYNSNKRSKLIIATSQSLFNSIDECSLLICDEIHEHTTSIDTLIMIARLIKLQLVLISATIDADKDTINKFFLNHSYIDIKGPTRNKIFSISYNIVNINNYKQKNYILDNLVDVLNKVINKYIKIGDTVMIFLPTKSWIDEFSKMIKYENVEYKELHKDVPKYDENVIQYFSKEKIKKHIILSTPIAESSITIDYLDLVIDTGLFYDTNYDVQNINLISYPSHIQRKGRVGRIKDGYYISLYNPDILSKSLRREIDGERLFIPIMYLYHYIYKISNRIVTKKDIIDNYIFPPKNINRINDVYEYLMSKNLFQLKYTQLLLSGLKCDIIDYMFIYEKYKETNIFIELKEYEENEQDKQDEKNKQLNYKLSDTLFRELYKLNKKIYHTNGKCYYYFFNDDAKYFKLKKNVILTNGRYYKIIKYNNVLIKDD